MTDRLSARSDVATHSPERYAKQLVAHLGRTLEFTQDGATSTASIGGATAQIVFDDGVITLLAEAPDQASPAPAQYVLGRHLERFGRRDELVVSRTTGG